MGSQVWAEMRLQARSENALAARIKDFIDVFIMAIGTLL